MLTSQLWAGFQSFPPLPISKMCPSGSDSQVGGFVYIPRTCGLSHKLPRDWDFPLPPQLPKDFSVRGFETSFSCTETLGCVVSLAPQFIPLVHLFGNVGLPAPPADTWPGPPVATLP